MNALAEKPDTRENRIELSRLGQSFIRAAAFSDGKRPAPHHHNDISGGFSMYEGRQPPTHWRNDLIQEDYAIYYKGKVFDTYKTEEEAKEALDGMKLSDSEKSQYRIRQTSSKPKKFSMKENIDLDMIQEDYAIYYKGKVFDTYKTEAEIVVSAGRGLKGPENWGVVEELAKLLHAATACSRPVADAHWRPHNEHVGQTGIAIAPNLYIAIGISGAIQHLAGVNRSKVIVVINKDPEAPFFKAADYGIVGDAFEVMPKFIAAVKKLKGVA